MSAKDSGNGALRLSAGIAAGKEKALIAQIWSKLPEPLGYSRRFLKLK